MNLLGVVSVSGKQGLFKLLARTKSGFVLESLDEKKNKVVANLVNQKFSSLSDITIYSDNDEDFKLQEIFENILKFEGVVPNVKTADNKELRTFFREVAPNHDEERVYTSDIKKIINWYNIIKELPLFTEEPSEEDKLALAGNAQA